jgi:hypothetical protein
MAAAAEEQKIVASWRAAAPPPIPAIHNAEGRMALEDRSRSLAWWTEIGQVLSLRALQDRASDRQDQNP